MKNAKATNDLPQTSTSTPNIDSLDKVVAKTIPKKSDWTRILHEEPPNDPSSIK